MGTGKSLRGLVVTFDDVSERRAVRPAGVAALAGHGGPPQIPGCSRLQFKNRTSQCPGARKE